MRQKRALERRRTAGRSFAHGGAHAHRRVVRRGWGGHLVLESVFLAPPAHLKRDQLSGGQQQDGQQRGRLAVIGLRREATHGPALAKRMPGRCREELDAKTRR
jgi:hypothetical protein